MNRLFTIGIGLLALSVTARAGVDLDLAPLDPGPVTVRPVLEDSFGLDFLGFRVPSRSDVASVIKNQTPVKSQGARGTCSIFSSTGLIESLIKMHYQQELDLSENYLEYLVMSRLKSPPSEGSDAPYNFPAFQRFGAILEAAWPYDFWSWEGSLPEEEAAKAEATCGKFTADRKKACLLGHRDPMQDPNASDAAKLSQTYKLSSLYYTPLNQQSQIKAWLNAGRPVVVSLEFFYGAWNHRLMVDYGIGERDLEKWAQGVVSTPTANDINISRKYPEGHSLVVVGYDDTKQVYYFKNSWGLGGFGVKSDILGADSTPGYGSISYGYAHNYGGFYAAEFR